MVVLGAGVAGLEAALPLELYAPMLDEAASAPVPLEETGDSGHPVRLRPGADRDYTLDVSRRRRAGKRLFSSCLLTRFAAAGPFDAGPGRRFMDLGVHAMAGMPL